MLDRWKNEIAGSNPVLEHGRISTCHFAL